MSVGGTMKGMKKLIEYSSNPDDIISISFLEYLIKWRELEKHQGFQAHNKSV